MGMTIDFGQLVMDNEFAKMIKHTVKGIPVDDQHLAVDVIHEIGVGKDFLSHQSTYDYMRTLSSPKLIDRKTREDWEREGSTDIFQRSMEEVRYILENHTPEPIPDDILAKMRSIVEGAEEELGVTKGGEDST